MAAASLFMTIMCVSVVCGLSSMAQSSDCHEVARGASLLQVHPTSVHKLSADKAKLSPIPPLGMVKVHKTGSSTALKIMQNLASSRGMAIMFPQDDHCFGWPGSFPGEANVALHGKPSHKYELIANHAVFNSGKWRGYLKPNPHFVAVLREPMSQAVSAHDYFARKTPWEDHIKRIEMSRISSMVQPSRWNARFRNSQAYDLGWYEYVGGTSKYDHNQTVIRQWIDSLNLDFGHLGGIILTEHFDESLVLLKESLGVGFAELAYRKENVGHRHNHRKPSQSQLARLRKVYAVDIALYDHFNTTFWKHWQQADPEVREKQLTVMRRVNAELKATCDAGNCPPVWDTAESEWTSNLDKLYHLQAV